MWRWVHLALTAALTIVVVVLVVRWPKPESPPEAAPKTQATPSVARNALEEARLKALGYDETFVYDVRGGILDGWVLDITGKPEQIGLDAKPLLTDVRAYAGGEPLPLSAIDSTLIILIGPKARTGPADRAPSTVYLEVRVDGQLRGTRRRSGQAPISTELGFTDQSIEVFQTLPSKEKTQTRIAQFDLLRE